MPNSCVFKYFPVKNFFPFPESSQCLFHVPLLLTLPPASRVTIEYAFVDGRATNFHLTWGSIWDSKKIKSFLVLVCILEKKQK